MKTTDRRNSAAAEHTEATGRRAQLLRGEGRASDAASWGDTWRQARAWLLPVSLAVFLAVLAAGQAFAADQPAPEQISGEFGQCGANGAALCVVDGDTFRIGERRVRVVGIDTAEKRARCDGEREAALRSTLALQQWLNRGPFTMQPNPARAVDRYGRELQIVARASESGRPEPLAEWMQAEGGAREYDGGARSGWC